MKPEKRNEREKGGSSSPHGLKLVHANCFRLTGSIPGDKCDGNLGNQALFGKSNVDPIPGAKNQKLAAIDSHCDWWCFECVNVISTVVCFFVFVSVALAQKVPVTEHTLATNGSSNPE